MGVRPQALINYITKSGGGFDHQLMGEKRVFKMEELQAMVIIFRWIIRWSYTIYTDCPTQFDVSKINVNSSRLNPDLLDDCNRQELIQDISDPVASERLIREVIELVTKTYPEKYVGLIIKTLS